MTDAAPQELTIDQALQLGMQLHQHGHLEPAEALYQRILEVIPDHPDAIHMLGALASHRGQPQEAIRLIGRAIELAPNQPGFLNNLGNVHLGIEQHQEALDCYQRAIAIDPDRPDVLNNLGVLYRSLRRPAESEQAFQRAIELAPEFADARHNLANLYQQLGRIDEAVAQCCEALILEPHSARTRELLGLAYFTLKRYDEAAQVYREWLEQEPGNPRAEHHLAACTGQNVPTRASDAYVETVFDTFASSFDAKLAKLTYQAPQWVLQAVARLLGEPQGTLDVLDAGCGTGLCGPLIRPYAHRLIGVDLSGQMLARAQQRDVYDELVKAELTAFLQSREQADDLIISADTLCYFGLLDSVLAAAQRALKPGGALVFTVEAQLTQPANEAPYHLQPHGRYSHHQDYLVSVLASSGLQLADIEQVHLRDEGGQPVHGWLISAVKAV